MLREGLVVVLRSVLVLLIALAALLAAGVLLAPATGHGVVVLRSGSMAPGMPVGSLALIESVEPGEVRAGDVVTVEPGVYLPGIGGVEFQERLRKSGVKIPIIFMTA